MRTYAERGVIGARRTCKGCKKDMHLSDRMVWRCEKCEREVSLNVGSVVPRKLSLEVFDFVLNMWIDMIPPSHAKKLIDSRNPHLLPELYSLFRNLASSYVNRMIKPYF